MAANESVKVKSKKNSKGFFSFFKELKAEFKRITWPSKEDVKKSTVTVIAFCIICALIVAGLDFIFNNLFKLIFK